jgi:hypothetical protein
MANLKEYFHQTKFFLGVALDERLGNKVLCAEEWKQLAPLGQMFHAQVRVMTLLGTVFKTLSDLKLDALVVQNGSLVLELRRIIDAEPSAGEVLKMLAVKFPELSTEVVLQLQTEIVKNLLPDSADFVATKRLLGQVWCGIASYGPELFTCQIPPMVSFMESQIVGYAVMLRVIVDRIRDNPDFVFKSDPRLELV